MKKNKNNNRPFDNEIRQMRKNKVILLNLVKYNSFRSECDKRGIELGVGSQYGDGIILFEK